MRNLGKPKVLHLYSLSAPPASLQQQFGHRVGENLPGVHPIDDLLTDIEGRFAEPESKHASFRFRVADTILQGLRGATMIVADLIKRLIVPAILACIPHKRSEKAESQAVDAA